MLWSSVVFCQEDDVGKALLFDPNQIDADFLFGYYSQEGDHSVVTGGIGTEELTDQDYKVVIRVPVDSSRRITFRPNVNYYTSASTDQIDTKTSASREDFRVQLYFDYEKVLAPQRQHFKLSLGGSGESDYASKGIQLGWTQYDKKLNNSFSANVSAYFDDWVMIFPEELRTDSTILPTDDKRNSYALTLGFNGILNARMRGGISLGLTYQEGLLSTPFHRAYFQDRILPKIETLPDERVKLPLNAQLNYFPVHFLVLKLLTQQYWDSFGIHAQSARLETIVKFNPFLSVYPFYRWYQQSAADHFAPFAAHDLQAEYFTSDFDLSGFTSHHFGAGFRWRPLQGIWRFRSFQWPSSLDELNVRVSRYYRSDGLSSYQVAFAAGFSFIRQ